VQFYRLLSHQSPLSLIPDTYAEFDLAGLRLGIYAPRASEQWRPGDGSPYPSLSLCLQVSRLEAAIAQLQEIGYPPARDILNTAQGREVYAYDPDGNRLILYEPIQPRKDGKQNMDAADFQIVDGDLTPERLATYLEADAIAVDTETMGLKPMRDRLCLVQLCDAHDRVTVIRVARDQQKAPRLQQLLEAAPITKVFHFARFDLSALRHHLGIQVQPVFCTKIASKLARTYSPKHGLKDLIQEVVGIELDKSAQSSDWGNAHNLSEAQLHYAANDVRYLLVAQQKLTAMLEREDRLALAQQCFACLPTFAALDILQYDSVFEH
jgi:ribonuclease D